MIVNPYTPGAGFMPTYLAGRDTLVTEAKSYLQNIMNRYPQQSVVYYGLRGVGKTVLLNQIEKDADDLGILYTHIEASEPGREKGGVNRKFTRKLIAQINKLTSEVSLAHAAKELCGKLKGTLKAFAVTYSIEDNSFSLGMTDNIVSVSGDYSADITDILVQLGKSAEKSGNTICFFIDEIQYLAENELSGLITALHRCNQLRLPVMIFCAGLPKILKTMGEANSYSERLFKFERIDSLDYDSAKTAIEEPATKLNVTFEQAATEKIIDITSGYPYFIQQLCNTVWGEAAEKGSISLADVETALPTFFKTLDAGFFAVRYDRCTALEKSFMTAMVKCGELPCTISNVAKIMDRKNVTSISPLRGQLIAKGMIYPTARGEIDFTVPQFDDFIKRVNPSLSL